MRTWIFQANPDRYDVLDDLARGRPITTWSVTRHVKDLSPGDQIGRAHV